MCNVHTVCTYAPQLAIDPWPANDALAVGGLQNVTFEMRLEETKVYEAMKNAGVQAEMVRYLITAGDFEHASVDRRN